MAITASEISTANTLEQFRTEYNNLRDDVSGLESGTISFSAITSTSIATSTITSDSIVFEGATDDAFETTLAVTDPTADRTITLPNETGTLHTSGGTTTHTAIVVADGATIGSASSTSAITVASTGIVTFVDDILIKDGGTIGNASVADVMTLASTGIVTFKDDLLIKDGGTIGVASSTSAITIASTGIVTFVDDIIIKDAGTIGSASDTDAISISSGGVVNISATTANTGTGDGALTVAGGVGIAADVSIGDDLRLISDSAVLSFGADSEITLTHVADTGLNIKHTATADDKPIILTLQTGETDIAANDVMGAIRFQAPDEGTGTDAILIAAAIQAVSEGDFAADNNATKLEFHTGASEAASSKMSLSSGGNLTVSGNVSVGGDLDVTGTFDLSDSNFTNAGSIQLDSIAGDADTNTSITFSGSDVITIATGGSTAATFNASQVLTLSGNLLIPDAGTIGSASDTDAISISSGGVVNISATTANTSASDGALTVAGGLGVALDASIGDDLRLISDSAVVSFGTNSEITLTHVHNSGLTVTNTVNGSDDTPVVLQLKSEEDAIVADDVIASIEMAAGDSDGTDGATVAAGIHAIAEGTFSASANATKLVFTTGVSETAAASATAKMTLSSAGLLTVADDFIIKDGGTIGVTSANDAMTISSAGIVTFKDDILIKDGGTIGVASATTAITISSAGIVTLVDDLVIKDGGTIGTSTDADALTIAAAGAVTFSQKDVHSVGLTVGNGSSSAGFVEFLEDSDNGTNKVTLIGPASTADVTLTLPSATDTLATSGDVTALAIALG